MRFVTVQIGQLNIDNFFRLSFPIDSEGANDIQKKLPGFPGLIIDGKKSLVYGHDLCRFFESEGVDRTQALELQIERRDALFLNFGLKLRFLGLNVLEKLIFLEKALTVAGLPEIQRLTDFEFKVDSFLLEQLPRLTTENFARVLKEGRLTLPAALKLCRLNISDREDCLKLFSRVSFSSSHQFQLIEWLQEILFREKIAAVALFEEIGINALLAESRPQKNIMAVLFGRRFPLYEKESRLWREKVDELNLPEGVRVSHAPFFEKKGVELIAHASGLTELSELLVRLRKGTR